MVALGLKLALVGTVGDEQEAARTARQRDGTQVSGNRSAIAADQVGLYAAPTQAAAKGSQNGLGNGLGGDDHVFQGPVAGVGQLEAQQRLGGGVHVRNLTLSIN